MSLQGKAIGDKRIIEKDGKKFRQFTTGPIKGTPYSMRRDGAIVRRDPKPLDKKQRRRCLRAQQLHPDGVWIYCDQCKAKTFHEPSHSLVKVEGYEDRQREETYQCCLCGAHYTKSSVDAALAEQAAKQPEDQSHVPGS